MRKLKNTTIWTNTVALAKYIARLNEEKAEYVIRITYGIDKEEVVAVDRFYYESDLD